MDGRTDGRPAYNINIYILFYGELSEERQHPGVRQENRLLQELELRADVHCSRPRLGSREGQSEPRAE